MRQQELDLFEIAAGLLAKLGASTPQIMGAKMLDAYLLG
jgi:hypothetical protein